MAKPDYQFVPSPHKRRRTQRITALVIHYTGSMSLTSTVGWFQRPESKVSAHYVVGRMGEVVQMVLDGDIAWHAGRSAMRPDLPDGDPKKEPNVNGFSMGIELVATADGGYTNLQLASLYFLIELIVSKYKIPPERVVGHSFISPGRKIDPEGYSDQFPWGKAREVARVAYVAALAKQTGDPA